MSAPDCRSVPRVLSIAGSDSGGGAGIQADLKTIAAWGGYGLTAITAVTAQNTQGVQAVHPLPVDVVRAQLDSVAADIGLDAVKIGMLGSPELRDAVRDWLERVRPPRVVLDPVMVASSGDALSDAAVPAGWAPLLAAVDVVTPNLPELAALTGADVPARWADALELARGLAAEHGVTVVLKGGHLRHDADLAEGVPDAVIGPEGRVTEVRGARVSSRSTHGTGCTLSSALAVLAAGGTDWEDALRTAKPWLAEAIAAGERLDVGRRTDRWHGPLDHSHRDRGAGDRD